MKQQRYSYAQKLAVDSSSAIVYRLSQSFALAAALIGALELVGWICKTDWLISLASSYIPMAPITGIYFILYGLCLTFTRNRYGNAVRQSVKYLLIFLTIFSFLLFIASLLKITSNIEHLGIDLHEMSNDWRVGHMSALTAICFAVIGISGILSMSRRLISNKLAFFGTISVNLCSLTFIFAYILGAPVMYESGVKLPALSTSIALTLLGLSVFIRSLRKIAPNLLSRRFLAPASFIAALITVAVIVSSIYLREYRDMFLRNVNEQLKSITELKNDELLSWRSERMGDASVYLHNTTFVNIIQSYIRNPNNPELKESIILSLELERVSHFYDHITLLDSAFAPMLSAPNSKNDISPEVIKHAKIAIDRNEVVFVDFFQNLTNDLELAVITPFYWDVNPKSPAAVMYMSVNPVMQLLPYFEQWPSPFESAKLNLLKVIDDTAYQIERAHSDSADVNDSYHLRKIDCHNPKHIGRKLLEAKRGFLEGNLCDGTRVSAYAADIGNTGWTILATIEMKEIYHPIRVRLWSIIAVQIFILLASAILIESSWRKQRNSIMAKQIEAQEALIEEEEKYRKTVNSLHEGLQIIDQDWRYVYMNSAAAEHGRLDISELIGNSMIELFPGIDKTPLFRRLKACRKTGKPDSFENLFVYPDGTSRWYHLSVQPSDQGLIILSTDIEDRKQAELRVEHLNKVLRSIRDVNQLIVHETDRNTLLQKACDLMIQNQSYQVAFIVQTNENNEPQTWFKAGYIQHLDSLIDMLLTSQLPHCYSKAIGMNDILAVKIPAEDCRFCPLSPTYDGYQALFVKLSHRGNPFGILHVVMGKGIKADFEERMLLKELAEDISYALSTIRNIEHRKNLEKQLQQSRKLEAIGRLAGGVAHDFNNMLQTIIGYSEILLQDSGLSRTQTEYVEEIQKAGKRSAELTYQLLAFSRKQTIEPKIIDINRMIRELHKMLRRLIGEDIELNWHPGDSIPAIKMDEAQLNQILINLVVNARDAIVNTGIITIETAVQVLENDERLGKMELKQGEYVILSVSDTGSGIEKDNIDKIFEPFFTTKEPGKGTGLGLSTIYGIVKQNYGSINVYSEPEEGTTFRIYFPAYKEQFEDDLHFMKISPPKGVETILLVEDEKSLIKLTERQLRKLGYEVIACNSPEMALDKIKGIQKLDLLITDVIMPGMSGKDLWEKLRTQLPDLNCLFMSGYTANVITHHGVLDAGIHFISKPFTIKDISLKIREILEGKP